MQANGYKTDKHSYHAVTFGKAMIGRNLTIALVVSLGVHLFGMSAVTIITPDDMRRKGTYTSVVFLGPILKKTAFDIMLENIDSTMSTTYRHVGFSPKDGYLKVVVAKRESLVPAFPKYQESKMDTLVLDFLTETKIVPGLNLGLSSNRYMLPGWGAGESSRVSSRKVIYKGDPPVMMSGFYGEKAEYNIRVDVLVRPDGKVKRSEPLTTTGYPQLDIMASEFAKSWIFEPHQEAADKDEWHVVDVILKAGSD